MDAVDTRLEPYIVILEETVVLGQLVQAVDPLLDVLGHQYLFGPESRHLGPWVAQYEVVIGIEIGHPFPEVIGVPFGSDANALSVFHWQPGPAAHDIGVYVDVYTTFHMRLGVYFEPLHTQLPGEGGRHLFKVHSNGVWIIHFNTVQVGVQDMGMGPGFTFQLTVVEAELHVLAVISDPSWNLTPLRILNVYDRPSAAAVNSSQTPQISTPGLRGSYSTRLL